MTSPTLSYDRDANALPIRFSSNRIDETVAVSDAVSSIDLDEAGDAVGFEILNATSAELEDLSPRSLE